MAEALRAARIGAGRGRRIVVSHRLRRIVAAARWGMLLAAAAVLVVFLVAQRQSADVRYGQSPTAPDVAQGSAGELSGATLPSVEAMSAMLDANPVVRLPGAVAQWDEARVRTAMGGDTLRILVAPPGLTEDQQTQLYDVDNADVLIMGTRVAGGALEATADTLPDWRSQFARDDVTNALVTLIYGMNHHGATPPDDGTTAASDAAHAAWRDPTAAELDTVAVALRNAGRYVAPGATLSAVPAEATRQAFGTTPARYVALPAQPADRPAPDYGPALARLFPDTALVVMEGQWIQYYGPHAADFADLAGASFYARFAERLSTYAYPQDNVLRAYLAQVADVRYAGLFDRPLPYRPFDPGRLALPALPWVFAACVAGFLALSARSLLRSRPPRRGSRAGAGPGPRARLAGLTALAVEVSPLTGVRTNPALTRAIGKLGAAREAIEGDLPHRRVVALLDDAQRELDEVGRGLEFDGYRPEEYLARWQA